MSGPVVAAAQDPDSERLFPGADFWIMAIIVTMPIREAALATIGFANIRIGDVIILIAVLAWGLSRSVKRRHEYAVNGLDKAVLVFVILYAASLGWSDQFTFGWIRVSKIARNGLFYLLIANYLRANFRGGYKRIALCLMVTGVLQSVAYMYSMSQFGGVGALDEMFGAFALPSNDARLEVVRAQQGGGLLLRGVASWLPLCMFFAASVLHEMKNKTRSRLAMAAILVMGVMTILSMTRAAWIAMTIGGFVYIGADAPRAAFKRLTLLTSVSLIVIVFGAYPTLERFVGSRFSADVVADDPAIDERLSYFQLAFDRFLQSPLFGAGAASIDPSDPEGFVVVHNVYLQVLGELGLSGAATLAAMLWLWVVFLLRVRRNAMTTANKDRRIATAAMLALTAFFLAYFVVGHDLGSGEPWLVMAVASALYSTRSILPKAALHQSLATVTPARMMS